MQEPFKWSTVCKVCGRKYYFVDEDALLEQNIGVPIIEDGKMMIEGCPFCFEETTLEKMKENQNAKPL